MQGTFVHSNILINIELYQVRKVLLFIPIISSQVWYISMYIRYSYSFQLYHILKFINKFTQIEKTRCNAPAWSMCTCCHSMSLSSTYSLPCITRDLVFLSIIQPISQFHLILIQLLFSNQSQGSSLKSFNSYPFSCSYSFL
jgi:hypothetical protein